MFQGLPVSSSKLFVWAFIPYRITEQGLISEYDISGIGQELADVFAELGVVWKWQPISLENMYAVVEEVAASSNKYIPVVLNYCDGLDEIDGYPGLSAIKLLEAKGIIFTGATSIFEYLSASKIRMKRAFVEAGVSTAAYEVISDISHVQGVCDRLGSPLIVKSATSYGSAGLSLQSVVYSDEQVSSQFQRLLSGQHGMQFSADSIFVERFINGSEFKVFLVGSAHQPDSLKIYPPLEIIFHSSLPETEQFLSHERYWGKDEGEKSFSLENRFCRFRLVDSTLHQRLCELGKRAYCAVGGNGYGMVDVRLDKASQELFVLEVNANCYISSMPLSTFSELSESPVGTILHLAGIPFAQLMSEMIAEAFARHSTKPPLLNKVA